MKRNANRAAALGLVFGLLAALLSFPAAAVEIKEAEDLLRGRWYATELIIFERLSTAEAGPEELARTGERTYPANLRAMAEDKPWQAAKLNPLTRACLEFPRLEVRQSSASPPAPSAASPLTDSEVHQPAPSSADLDFPASPAGPDLPASPSEQTFRRELPSIHPTLAPHPLLDLLSAAARFERSLQQNSYRWLDANALQLRTEARRIRQATDMRVIWHGRWMQPAPPRSAGEPLLLQLGPQSSDVHAPEGASGNDFRAIPPSTPQSGGVHALEGTLQITLGRYLHFRAQLWQPASAAIESQTDRSDSPAEAPAPWQTATLSARPQTFPYIELNESRAMRSGELHYLDHPQIGVLVRIDPVPASLELAQALETWKQAEAEG